MGEEKYTLKIDTKIWDNLPVINDKETTHHAMDAMRYVYLGGRASSKSESIKEMFKKFVLGEEDMLEPKIRVKKLIFDYPATIVYWYDGTKTVVKCREGETFDKETGLAMAMCKKLIGDKYKSRFRKIIKGAVVKHTEPEKSNMEKLNDVLDHIIDDIDEVSAKLHTATTDEITNLLESEDGKSGLLS